VLEGLTLLFLEEKELIHYQLFPVTKYSFVHVSLLQLKIKQIKLAQ
jgi:hypothetical protein